MARSQTSVISTESNEKNKSSFKTADWNRQQEAWKITDDLFEDALHIRQQGRKYLEQFKKEPNEKYEYRRANSVMINRFRDCIESMSGTVFRDNPVPDEAANAIAKMFTDIDLQGNSLHSFCIDAFEAFLKSGNGFIHVDAPSFVSKTGARPTAQDRAGHRPFLKFYEAKQAINHQHSVVNGRLVLSTITFEMSAMVPDGDFGEKCVTKHLVMTIGKVRELTRDEGKDDFLETSSFDTGLDFIPVVNIAEFGSAPPLIALALLNVQHYNKTSDFDDWCHTACVPEKIYQYETKQDADSSKGETAVASPGMARLFWGKEAKVYFAEVTGAGLEIAKSRYQDVEAEMARIGIGMFAPTEVAPRSATEVVDTAGRRESKLARYTRDFENAIEKALYMTGQVFNSIIPNSVDLSEQEVSKLRLKIDYDRLTFSVEQMRFYGEMVDSGKMSLRTFLEFLMERTDMPDDFSVETELQRIKDEGAIVVGTEPPPVPPAA